jgi:hypothetical protein
VKTAFLFALCSLAIGASGAAAGPTAANAIYVVRPDPRACPSPLCGGYWAALANHTRTRCHDGLYRRLCYVATVNSATTRKPFSTPVPAGALVQGTLGSETFEGVARIGVLWATDVWAPVGSEPASGRYFRLRDTGIRCVRAPCFSFRARRLTTPARTTVSSVDLGPARATAETLRRAEAALASPSGLLAAGRISATTDGGRLFRATQVYLKTASPHA